jgi:hypothetical protein
MQLFGVCSDVKVGKLSEVATLLSRRPPTPDSARAKGCGKNSQVDLTVVFHLAVDSHGRGGAVSRSAAV